MSSKKEHRDGERTSTAKPTGPVSRRALLRGAVTAMPAVLTLQSGAAHARSSNLISASPWDHKDRRGRTLCMDKKSVYPAGGRKFDLGNPAYARVTAIHDRDFRLAPHHGAARVSEAQMCHNGGTYYYRTHRPGRWSSHTAEEQFNVAQDVSGSSYIAGAQSGGGANANSWDHSYYDRRRWRKVKIRRGVLVSATALSSFAGNIVVKDL